MGSKVNDALNLRRRAMSKDVDEGYIKSYMSDSRNYFTQAKSDIDGLTWESATNTDKINSRNYKYCKIGTCISCAYFM